MTNFTDFSCVLHASVPKSHLSAHSFFPDYISAVRTGVCAYMDATLLRSLILGEFFTRGSTVLAAIMMNTSVAIYTSC